MKTALLFVVASFLCACPATAWLPTPLVNLTAMFSDSSIDLAIDGFPAPSFSPASASTLVSSAGVRSLRLALVTSGPSVPFLLTAFSSSGAHLNSTLSNGTIPVSFNVSISCPRASVSTVSLTFSFSGAAFSPLSIAFGWTCAPFGCGAVPGGCGIHGSCNAPAGRCVCQSGWVGENCSAMVSVPSSSCPMADLPISFDFPSLPAGSEPSVAVYRLSDEELVDFRYFSSWSPTRAAGGELSGTRNLTAATTAPGEFELRVVLGDGGGVFASLPLTVLPWAECGAARNGTCTSAGECSGEPCDGGICRCSGGQFGADCSRGCRKFTVLSAGYGTISSDTASPGRYTNDATCTWLVEPGTSEVTSIVISFREFDLERGDTVSVFDPPAGYNGSSGSECDGCSGRLLGRFTGAEESPSEVEFGGRRIVLIFKSDHTTTNRGFTLWYRSERPGLLPGHIALIVIGSIVAAVVGVSAVVVVMWRVTWGGQVGRGRERMKSEIMGEADQAEALGSDLHRAWASLEEFGIRVNKNSLSFGLVAKSVFPLDTVLSDQVVLTNASGRPVNFVVSVPAGDRFTFTVKATPGRGTIDSHEDVPIQVSFALHYTARVSKRVKMQFFSKSSGRLLGTSFVEICVEGALSDRLDPDDITLFTPPIAVGAFGTVYRGSYRSRLVAVKVLKRQNDLTEQEFADFTAETDLYRRLRGSFIAEYIGASYLPGRLCMCTELMNHGSLEDLIHESRAAMSYLLMLKFALNIAEGMAFLHANNILYRDLKPGNVLIVSTASSAKINCKITDFGTARNVENAAELYRHTGGIGTAIYTAPEVMAVEGYNTKADVFSFAVTMWEMWTRQLPWSNVVCWDVPRLVIEGKRPAIPEDCPPDYARLIAVCWKQDHRERPSFHELVGEIADIFKLEKQLARGIKVPAPPKTAEQLRELRIKAEMEEEPVKIQRAGRANTLKDISASPDEAQVPTGDADVAGTSAAAAAAAVPPQVIREDPPGYMFRRESRAEKGHKRSHSLDRPSDLPPIQEIIKISGAQRKMSTRSILSTAAADRATVPVDEPEAEKAVGAGGKRHRHRKHEKKHKKDGAKVGDERQSPEKPPVDGHEEQIDQRLLSEIPVSPRNQAPAEAVTPRDAQMKPASPRPVPPVSPSPAPVGSGADVNSRQENLLQHSAIRRRPSWDSADVADTAAFKKVEDKQFRTFRRGLTIASDLGSESGTTRPATGSFQGSITSTKEEPAPAADK